MTAEHRLLMGLDDIRALTLECKKCGVRLSVSPDTPNADRLDQCPMCRAIWLVGDKVARDVRAGVSTQLVLAIEALRKEPNAGVRLLLEFDAPR